MDMTRGSKTPSFGAGVACGFGFCKLARCHVVLFRLCLSGIACLFADLPTLSEKA
jgi:hypothetical protein